MQGFLKSNNHNQGGIQNNGQKVTWKRKRKKYDPAGPVPLIQNCDSENVGRWDVIHFFSKSDSRSNNLVFHLCSVLLYCWKTSNRYKQYAELKWLEGLWGLEKASECLF